MSVMTTNKHWAGSEPRCEIGRMHSIVEGFVDGRTRMGPWGLMCRSCHEQIGYGLGLGKGQLYERQKDGRWLRTEG